MQQTESQKRAQQKYYEKNKFILNEKHKKYYYDNKEALLKTKKIYYLANRDKLIANMKTYYYNQKRIKISYEPTTIYFS